MGLIAPQAYFYIHTGQSNATRRATQDAATFGYSHDPIDGINVFVGSTDSFEAMDPADNTGVLGGDNTAILATPDAMSSEVAAMQDLQNALGHDIYLMKYGKGGKALAQIADDLDFNPASTGEL